MAVHASRMYFVMARDGSSAKVGPVIAPAAVSATAVANVRKRRLGNVVEILNDYLAVAARRARRVPLIVDVQVHMLMTRNRNAIDELMLRDEGAILGGGK